MKDYALALCGGGGKGAYQIGVYKALYEKGMLNSLKAVSGTSVGALNAVLFALGDYENAKRIWYSVSPEALLSPNDDISDGLCTRQGLEDILSDIELPRLKYTIPVFVNMRDVKTGRTVTRKINGLSRKEITETLLASSAMSLVYGHVYIKGREYADGGSTRLGNTPVKPLYKSGFRNIIVVPLDNFFTVPDNMENTKITVIKPSETMDALGIIDFTKSGIRDKMIMGYKDTLKTFGGTGADNMKNKYTRINFLINQKMNKLFKKPEDLEKFIKVTNFSNINLEMKTVNMQIFYENIAEPCGWKVQQHKVIGLKGHYRILDEKNIRRAWVLSPKELLNSLEDYDAAINFEK